VTTYTVRLTVTDAAGTSSTSVRTIVVAAAGDDPGLHIDQLFPHAHAGGAGDGDAREPLLQRPAQHRLFTSPVTQTVFSDGCNDPTGVAIPIGGTTLFPAGTGLQLSVLSGTVPNSTIAFSPTLRVSGDFTQGWTLVFDDGYGGPSEPDFNDLVILVKATP
jgi:PKD repeat protein